MAAMGDMIDISPKVMSVRSGHHPIPNAFHQEISPSLAFCFLRDRCITKVQVLDILLSKFSLRFMVRRSSFIVLGCSYAALCAL
jgi:hypothetical protein